MTERELMVVTLRCLEEALSELVLIGAWAHRFYEFHPLAQDATAPPTLMTVDVDFAIAAAGIGGSLHQMMLKASFRESIRGDARPPATKYHPPGAEGDDGFYVEFVTPMTGGATRRSGEAKETREVSGIVAWELRDIDILLVDPWLLDLDSSHGLPIDGEPISIRIAAPERYLLQKCLSAPRRSTPYKDEGWGWLSWRGS